MVISGGWHTTHLWVLFKVPFLEVEVKFDRELIMKKFFINWGMHKGFHGSITLRTMIIMVTMTAMTIS